jgi:hypothetical protein
MKRAKEIIEEIADFDVLPCYCVEPRCEDKNKITDAASFAAKDERFDCNYSISGSGKLTPARGSVSKIYIFKQ